MITIPIAPVMRKVRVDVTLKTTGLRFARLRLKLSAVLFRAAAWVAGVGSVSFTTES